jgi:intracellular multiplication protein IcmE
MMSPEDYRTEICESLGIKSIVEAHRIIASGVKQGVDALLRRGLNAETLTKLGYTASGMGKLGYGQPALERLGYYPSSQKERVRAEEHKTEGEPDVKQLIASGHRAGQLREMGLTVYHCKKAGYSAIDLASLGFSLADLVSACSSTELRLAGFDAHELRNFFPGQELRGAGFNAREMRIAGYTPRDLLGFGFNENEVVTAGYSVNELVREGLSKRTKLGVKKT